MKANDPFLAAFDALPAGAFEGDWHGLRWIGAKTAFAGHRSYKLAAEAADGSARLCANLYRFADGRALLAPCEVPADTVRGFVLDLRLA